MEVLDDYVFKFACFDPSPPSESPPGKYLFWRVSNKLFNPILILEDHICKLVFNNSVKRKQNVSKRRGINYWKQPKLQFDIIQSE